MLKHCFVNVDYARLHAKQQLPPKCGEIYYENECSFQLVCSLCEMKHFCFEDFVQHIHNVHFDKQGKPLTHTVTAAPYIDDDTGDAAAAGISGADGYDIMYLSESEASDSADETPLRVLSVKSTKVKSVKHTIDEALLQDAQNSVSLEIEASALDANTQNDEYTETTNPQKTSQPKEYRCSYCTRNYATIKYLNLHIKMSHPHPNAFKCNECNATFDVDRALESHRRKVHTVFTCKQCAKVFKSSRTLLRHTQGHSGLRKYKCDFENCEKSFVNKHNLTSHRRVHSTERNYVCELCGYRSRYREALIVHRRTHTGEKPYKCQTCERCFASKSLLNEHQAMHSTERPFKCDKCDATFSRSKALYHHKHLHLGIKKFNCKLCGNAYAQAAGLSAHMRVHRMQAMSDAAAGAGEISGTEQLFGC